VRCGVTRSGAPIEETLHRLWVRWPYHGTAERSLLCGCSLDDVPSRLDVVVFIGPIGCTLADRAVCHALLAEAECGAMSAPDCGAGGERHGISASAGTEVSRRDIRRCSRCTSLLHRYRRQWRACGVHARGNGEQPELGVPDSGVHRGRLSSDCLRPARQMPHGDRPGEGTTARLRGRRPARAAGRAGP
jgi:hypothetical protein